MSDFKPIQGEFTGRHMLLIMIAFFGVIIGVNILMAMVASQSWTGLVVKNSYVASQNFNAELAEARRQAERGWTERLDLDAREARVRLSDGAGPMRAATVTLKLSRPTHENQDRTIALTETMAGEYRADVALDAGVWSAEVTATSDRGEVLRRTYRIIIPAKAGS
jgi:nitrogen fixation protein FixH